jgi:dTDP-4-dehydrorhamnose reductase
VRRVLITGGSGYLGQHLVPSAVDRYDVLYTFLQNDPLALPGASRLDLLDRDAVLSLVGQFRPQVIIHTAGSNRSPNMEAVIREGTRHIVEAAGLSRARLIYLSTDVVFDGQHGPYRESDPVNPLHAYGRVKATAEELVDTHPDRVIIRTSLIYGLNIMDRSTEWIVAGLRAGQEVTLFNDQWRNPVWVESLSQACLELAGLAYQGTLHVAGQQALTRAEFGLKLLDWWGIEERATLRIGPSDDRWPRDCRLDINLAQELLATPLPGLDEVLAAPRPRKA